MSYKISDLLPETISIGLSALSYDEKNCQDNINNLFPDSRSHFWSFERGAQFFGIVYENEDAIFQVNRGTDGYTWFSNIHSWFYNVNILTGPDGIHNGFEFLGNRVFNVTKEYLSRFKNIYFVGHSQGGSITPYLACLAVENLSWVKNIYFYGFETAPCFDKNGVSRVQNYINDGKVHGNLFATPGDPISSSILRNKKSILLDGVDAVPITMMPDVILYSLGLKEAINHSPMLNIYSYMRYLHDVILLKHPIDYIFLLDIAERIEL